MSLIDRVPPVLRWVAVIGWMALLFLLSARPSPTLSAEPIADVLIKKAGHLALYAVLAAGVAWVVASTRWAERALVIGFVVAVAYGLSDEAHQALTPGRSPSLVDVGIDAIGAVIGLAAFELVVRRPGRRRSS